MNAVTRKIIRVRNQTDGEPAQKRLIASYFGEAFVSERQDDKLNIYHVSGDTIATNTIGDAPLAPGSGRGKPDYETTMLEFLANMNAEERADLERRAVEWKRLSAAQEEQARLSSSAWNARQGQTTDKRLFDKSFFPQPNMTAAKMQKDIEKRREMGFWG
jgi:hypothetical protein